MSEIASLFNTIYSSVSTPTEVQGRVADTEKKLLDIQVEKTSLQNQKAFQDAMMKIWGPTGYNPQAVDAAASGDVASQAKLKATMQVYGMYAPDKLPAIENAMTNSLKRSEDIAKERQRTVGNLFSAVQDADSYRAIFPEIVGLGGFQSLGLTGNWDVDQTRVRTLGRAGMTANQQSMLPLREMEQQSRLDRQAETERHNKEMEALRASSEETARSRIQALNDHWSKVEQQRREGQDIQANKALAQARGAASRVTDKDVADTLGYIKEDERFKGVSKKLLPQIARQITTMAHADVAASIKDLGDVPSAEAWMDSKDKAIEKLQKEGKLKSFTDTFLGIPVGRHVEYDPSGKPSVFEKPTPAGDSKVDASFKLTPDQSEKINRLAASPKNRGIPRDQLIKAAKEAGLL